MGCSASKDPGTSPPPAVAYASAAPSGGGAHFEEEGPEPTGPDLRVDVQYMWYWEEDKHRLERHHTWDKQGNFVAYPPKVSNYLEARYAAGGSADDLNITYKAFHAHTGFSYRVDFQSMRQINTGTGYERRIMRRENPNFVRVVQAQVVGVPLEPQPAEAGGSSLFGNFAELQKGAEPPARLFSTLLKTIDLPSFEREIAGANVDHQPPAGGTLLTWSAEFHRPDLCQALLARGADPTIADLSTGQTALQWAESTAAVGVDAAASGARRQATIDVLRKARGGGAY